MKAEPKAEAKPKEKPKKEEQKEEHKPQEEQPERKPKLTATEASHLLQNLNKVPMFQAKKSLIQIIKSMRTNKDFMNNPVNKQLLKTYIRDEKTLKSLGLDK